MASTLNDRYPPPPGRDPRRRDSGYRSPSEDSYDSRADSYYYHDDRTTQPPPTVVEEEASKRNTLAKLAVGAAIVYGIVRVWNGEKNAEKEKRRQREKRRDFEKRKAARRRDEERRERQTQRDEETEDEVSELTERKRIGYAPARSRSRRARSRAPDARDQQPPAPERSRSRGPPKPDRVPSPPSMTRASIVDGRGYEEHRPKRDAR